MALYPHVLKRAQEEIDIVIGNDRLPSFDDRENLPYINAICKEVFRWENVVPSGLCGLSCLNTLQSIQPYIHVGVPHVITEEDEYMGYRIPKGALVLPIIW